MGADNDLLMSKQFKLKFRCIFVLVFFPFDTQSCQFFIVMNIKGNTSIALDNSDVAIQYDGPFKLNEFEVRWSFLIFPASEPPFPGDLPSNKNRQFGKTEDKVNCERLRF